MLRLKRAYAQPAPEDGKRILVDRLWPRGLAKAAARIDAWYKHLAPSDALRRDFGHVQDKWPAFRQGYLKELAGLSGEGRRELDGLAAMAGQDTVTLCFAAHDVDHNNAVVLREYLQSQG